MEKKTIFTLTLLLFLISCAKEENFSCDKSEIGNLIEKRDAFEFKIVNRQKVYFKSIEKLKYLKNNEGYYSCNWGKEINKLEDHLNNHKVIYSHQFEVNKFGQALSYVLPGIILLGLLFSIVCIYLLFKNKQVNDVQRLTYLILIIFVPILGAIIYWSKRKNSTKN